jgi:hypothetical protein
VIQVHDLKGYEELTAIAPSDFFWRYNYKASTGEFRPKSVPVYCTCEEPYNPDLTMIECEACNEWYVWDPSAFLIPLIPGSTSHALV